MAYVLTGRPKTVVDYPEAKLIWNAWRTRQTKRDYYTAMGIAKRYKAGADYFKDKVPFISLQFGMEAKKAVNSALDYADTKAEIAEVKLLGTELVDLTVKQSNLALAIPTQEILIFINGKRDKIYKNSTPFESNQATRQLHEIEQLIKNDTWATMVSDLNSASFKLYYALHTGPCENKDTIGFNNVIAEKLLVASDQDIPLSAIKDAAQNFAQKIEKFMEKQIEAVGWQDGYEQRRNALLESQQKYLATAGKIIDGVKNEFDAFFTGVHAGAHIDIKTQIALEGIGKDIAKLAGNYPLDGNVK